MYCFWGHLVILLGSRHLTVHFSFEHTRNDGKRFYLGMRSIVYRLVSDLVSSGDVLMNL